MKEYKRFRNLKNISVIVIINGFAFKTSYKYFAVKAGIPRKKSDDSITRFGGDMAFTSNWW